MKLDARGVNLDAMSQADIHEFIKAVGNGVRPIAAARLLFPDRQTDYVVATRQLRNYAWNKVTAMSLRVSGDIQNALGYERICDSIYSSLPDYAKFW